MQLIGCASNDDKAKKVIKRATTKEKKTKLKDFVRFFSFSLLVSFDLQLLIEIIKKSSCKSHFEVHTAFYDNLAQTLSYSTS